MSGYTLDWQGEALLADIQAAAVDGMNEVGGRCVSAAQQQLTPGHGVLYGHLRRSIHTAGPSYSWAADQQGGGSDGSAEIEGDRVRLTFGSGIEYAWWVHEGHGSFQGYPFARNALDQVQGQAEEIVSRHVARVTR